MTEIDRFILYCSLHVVEDQSEDVQSTPSFSVEKAIEPLIPRFHNLKDHLDRARKQYNTKSNWNITYDEFAALYLYTHQIDGTSFGYELGKALQFNDRNEVRSWLAFKSLLQHATQKLPDKVCEIWCLVTDYTYNELIKSKVMVLRKFISGFSSPDFFDKNIMHTFQLCCIHANRAKMIPKFSSTCTIDEYILLPQTRLKYRSISTFADRRRYCIHVEQIDSDNIINRTIPSSNIHAQRKDRENAGTHQNQSPASQDHSPAFLHVYSITTMKNGDIYEIRYTFDGEEESCKLFPKGSQHPKSEGIYASYKVNGLGERIWSNGDKYKGDFKNGKMHGSGTLECFDGYTYHGSWQFGKPHGHGKSQWSNGHTYEGQHTMGDISGKGSFSDAVGNSYHGYLTKGKANGSGSRTWADGSQYEGEFRDDKKHGNGIYKDANGVEYNGNWSNDEMDGSGTLKWPGGTKYTGLFSHGKMHERGDYISHDRRFVSVYHINGRLINRT